MAYQEEELKVTPAFYLGTLRLLSQKQWLNIENIRLIDIRTLSLGNRHSCYLTGFEAKSLKAINLAKCSIYGARILRLVSRPFK